MKHMAGMLICLALSGCSAAGSQEVPAATMSLPDALDAGTALGSAGLSWPDGRQTVVTYVKVGRNVYRCADHFNDDFQPTGNLCVVLFRRGPR